MRGLASAAHRDELRPDSPLKCERETMRTSEKQSFRAGLLACLCAAALPLVVLLLVLCAWFCAMAQKPDAEGVGRDNLIEMIKSSVTALPTTLGNNEPGVSFDYDAGFEVVVDREAALKYGVRVEDVPTAVWRFADEHHAFEARALGEVLLTATKTNGGTVKLNRVADVRIYLRKHSDPVKQR